MKELSDAVSLKTTADGAMYVVMEGQAPRWTKDELAIRVGKTGDGRLFTNTPEVGSKFVADTLYTYSTKYANIELGDDSLKLKAMKAHFFQGDSLVFWQLRDVQERGGSRVHAMSW